MKLNIPEMSCGHCKAAIEQAVAKAGGTARVDLDRRQAVVENLDPARAIEVIRAAGYESCPA